MIRLLSFLAKLGLILLITVVLAEFALRALFDKYDPDQDLVFIVQPEGYRLGDPGTVSRHWKNTGDFDVPVRINAAGFRDSKDLADSSPEDWFVVGDSYAFGFGVRAESRFSNRLEKTFGVPVYNISIPNNLEGYIALVGHARGEGANIGRLIISVCMENDIFPYREVSHSRMKEVEAGIPVYRWNKYYLKHYLSDNSALYKAISMLVHQVPWLKSAAVEFGIITENLTGIPAIKYSAEAIESSAARAEKLARTPGVEDALFVIVPSRGLWVDEYREEHGKIHDGFVDALRARGLEVVDLRDDFESSNNPLEFHFQNDGHWNERGHAQAARAISRQLPRP